MMLEGEFVLYRSSYLPYEVCRTNTAFSWIFLHFVENTMSDDMMLCDYWKVILNVPLFRSTPSRGSAALTVL